MPWARVSMGEGDSLLITGVEHKTQADTQGQPQDGPAKTPCVRRDVTVIFINHPSFSFGHTDKAPRTEIELC